MGIFASPPASLKDSLPERSPLDERSPDGESVSAGEHSARAAPAGAGSPAPTERALSPLPAEWFHDHVEVLWRIVARLGVPQHGVDDIVQEAFITASRRRSEIGVGQERSFLIATAVRLCSNYRQRAHVRREVSRGDDFEQDAHPGPDAEQLLMQKRLRELLDGVLAQMSDAHRTLFVLYELEGCSVPELASLLALPLGTVSSRLWRARAKFAELAAALQSQADEGEP
jgi:RNA polymerase sigma-70 factor (ECF subfamily)